MKSFRSYLAAGLGFAMLVTIILLATGWGSAVAAQITSVIVTNPASNPAQVHEAGTANVNVMNTMVPVHEQGTVNVTQAPVTSGGSDFYNNPCTPDGSTIQISGVFSAFTIHMSSDVKEVSLRGPSGAVVAAFPGPATGFPADTSLALTRPISLGSVTCDTPLNFTGTLSMAFVGNSP
jgi:hypothetical protein